MKRRHKRIYRRLEVKFSCQGVSHTAVASNLSRYGLFVRTRKVIVVGTILDLELTIYSGEVLKMTGKVVYAIRTNIPTMRKGMGVELTDVPPAYKEFINSMD